MKNKILSLFLALVMIVTMIPINTVFAEEETIPFEIKAKMDEVYNLFLNSKASNPYTFDYGMYFAEYALNQESLKYNSVELLELYDNFNNEDLFLYNYIFDKSDDITALSESYRAYKSILEDIKSGVLDGDEYKFDYKIAKEKSDVSTFMENYITILKEKGRKGGSFSFFIIKGIDETLLTQTQFYISEKDYKKYMPIIKKAILDYNEYSYPDNDITKVSRKITLERPVDKLQKKRISMSIFDYGQKFDAFNYFSYIDIPYINLASDNSRRTLVVAKTLGPSMGVPEDGSEKCINYYLKNRTYKSNSNLPFKSTQEIGTIKRIGSAFNIEKIKNENPDLIDKYNLIEKNKEDVSKLKNMFDDSYSVGLDNLGYIEVGNVDKKVEKIPYKTIKKNNDTLPKGKTKVETEGKYGEKITVTTYEVDEKTGELENPKTEEKITEAVDEVILVGAKESDIFVPKEDNSKPEDVPSNYKTVEFKVGKEGLIHIESKFKVWVNPDKEIDLTNYAPKVIGKKGFTFTGWDKNLKAKFTEDTIINAVFKSDQKNNGKYPANKPEKKVEVVNKEKLTPKEKTKVEEEVKKANPEAKTIEVKDNGDVVITYPDDSTNELKQEDTVIEKKPEDTRKDNEKYPTIKPDKKVGVKDIDNLTYAEKDKVKEEVEKVNPHAKKFEVKDNGDVVITYPDGSTNELKQKDTVYEIKKSREPYVDKVHEGDEYITGKGEEYSYIEITLSNKRIINGKTDRYGEFKIKTPYKLYKDDVIYVNQTEFDKDPSDDVVVRVLAEREDKVKDKLKAADHYAYIVGYPDSTFRPNNIITRAEVTEIFARLSKRQVRSTRFSFSDVKPNDWFYNAVQIGLEEGFIKGYLDGTFRPSEPMTRAEFASIISTYASQEAKRQKFSDVEGWSTGVIDTAYANGWMKGYSDNFFRPNSYITRAEAVSVINRMLNRRPDKDFIAKELLKSSRSSRIFTDVNVYDWYFYDVYAATWGHDYEIKDGVEKWTKLNGKTFMVR